MDCILVIRTTMKMCHRSARLFFRSIITVFMNLNDKAAAAARGAASHVFSLAETLKGSHYLQKHLLKFMVIPVIKKKIQCHE